VGGGAVIMCSLLQRINRALVEKNLLLECADGFKIGLIEMLTKSSRLDGNLARHRLVFVYVDIINLQLYSPIGLKLWPDLDPLTTRCRTAFADEHIIYPRWKRGFIAPSTHHLKNERFLGFKACYISVRFYIHVLGWGIIDISPSYKSDKRSILLQRWVCVDIR